MNSYRRYEYVALRGLHLNKALYIQRGRKQTHRVYNFRLGKMEEDDNGENNEEVLDMDYEEDLFRSPLERTGHIALNYNNHMLVWGGYQDSARLPEHLYLPTTTICFYDYVLDNWHFQPTDEENAPPGTSGACGLIHSDMLFVFGGFCERGNTNEIYSLDLITFKWHKYEFSGARPLQCDKMVGWVHEERLYFFGGFGMPPKHPSFLKTQFSQFTFEETIQDFPDRGWNNQLVIFDPRAKKWIWPSFRGPPPLPRAAHGAAKIGNSVYIFGGRHKFDRMNDLHCLDLEAMTWSGSITMKGTIPRGRSWHSFTPISDKLVVLFGGFCQHQEALSDCWILNVSTFSWTEVKLPQARARLWHTACVGDQGEVLIFGGCSGNGLDPRPLTAEEHIIALWFSPHSLLRLTLDTILANKETLEPTWHALPLVLQKILKLKSMKYIPKCQTD